MPSPIADQDLCPQVDQELVERVGNGHCRLSHIAMILQKEASLHIWVGPMLNLKEAIVCARRPWGACHHGGDVQFVQTVDHSSSSVHEHQHVAVAFLKGQAWHGFSPAVRLPECEAQRYNVPFPQDPL